jgi:hypothetical protein
MSHRSRTNINSPHFMREPDSARKDAATTPLTSDDQSFLVKGDASSNSSNTSDSSTRSYEHIGGEDDVFIVNNNGGSFQLHRKTLKETLSELKKYSHMNVRQLDAEHTESLRSVVEALRLLYGSQALYDVVLADIRSIFGDLKEVKPGTIAAYFVGCFNDDNFSGPAGCSPKCAASLPPSEGTPGYSNCDDLVLIYSDDGVFSSLNEKRSAHAYIYISSSDFAGFTGDDLRQLRDAGIRESSLIFGNPDGSYREITGPTPIENLPLKAGSGKAVKSFAASAQSTESSNTGAVVFAIIIIIIIILLLALMYRNRRR